MKTVRKWMIICLVVCLCFISFSITKAAKKSIIVKSQKQLEKVLKEGKVTKIILKTAKNVKITIPKSVKAKNIILQVNAPNARIINKSMFKKILLKGNKVDFTEQATDNKIIVYAQQMFLSVIEDALIKELKIVKAVKNSDIQVKGSVETITTRSDKANIIIEKGAKVETIRTVKKGTKVNIVADGTVGTVAISGKQTNVEISGSSESVKVVVTSKDNIVTASVPVKIEVKGSINTEIVLKEGAENSEIKMNSTASITVENGTKEEIKVIQGSKTIIVAYGGKKEIKGEQIPSTAIPTPSTERNTGGGGNSDSNTQTIKEKALQAIKAVKTEADVKDFLENAEYVKAAKLDLIEYHKMDAALQKSVRTALLKEVGKLETITMIAPTWNEAVNQIVETVPIRLGLGETVEKYYQTFSETAKKEFEEIGKNVNSHKRATLTIIGKYINTDNFAIGANADVILLANSSFVNTEGTLTIEDGGTIQGRSTTSQIQNNSFNRIGSEIDKKYSFDANSEYIWESNTWKKVVVPEITSIEISGADSIAIPTGASITESYTETVKDQDAKIIEGEEVTWSLKGTDLTGVRIRDGILIIEPIAQAGIVTIVATLKIKTEIFATKEVTLTKADEPSEPEITSIEISGADSIAIPTGASITESYTETVKDQDAKIIESEEVTWSLKGTDLTGVRIRDGILIIEPIAQAGIVTIVATSKTKTEIFATKEVTLTKADEPSEPEITSIEISGADSIAIPTGVSITESYTETVKDQDAKIIEGEEVTWSLKGTDLTGVRIRDGILIIEPIAQAGIVTIVATSKTKTEIFATKEVTLTKADEPSEPEITSIEISGADSIAIPTGASITESYTETVKDQDAKIIEGEEVTWSLKGTDLTGVRIRDGILIIEPIAQAGIVTIVATSKTKTEIFATKEVILTKAGEPSKTDKKIKTNHCYNKWKKLKQTTLLIY